MSSEGRTLSDKVEDESTLGVSPRAFGPLAPRQRMKRRDAQSLHRPQCDKEPQAARRVSPSRVAELDEEDNPQDEDDDVRGRDEVRKDGEGVARE